MSDTEHYVIANKQPVVELDCTTSFRGLTIKEKLYAHYLSQASWHGGLIVLIQVSVNRVKLLYVLNGLRCMGTASSHIFHLQTSPESPLVFVLLHKLFSAQPICELKKSAIGDYGVSTDEFQVSSEN